MRKNAFESPADDKDYKNGMGRRALQSYLKYGYIPLEDSVPLMPSIPKNRYHGHWSMPMMTLYSLK